MIGNFDSSFKGRENIKNASMIDPENLGGDSDVDEKHRDSESGDVPDIVIFPSGEKGPTTGLVSEDAREGGLLAWGVVLGCLALQFCSSGYICSFGIFQDYYTRIYMTAHSASTISWIGSTAPFLSLVFGLVSGRLHDKGYCMHLIYTGAALISLSMFMLSFAKPNQLYVAFLCQGLGIGFGSGMITIPSLALVSQYFVKKQTLALSIVCTGVSLGSIISPIMVNNMLQKSNLGFATAIRIHAAVLTFILILGCVLIKQKFPPPPTQTNFLSSFKKLLREKAYVTLLAAFTCFGLGVFLPLFFIQLAAISHDLGKEFAFYSLVILNASACLGSIFCAIVSRKVGVDYLAVGSTIGCACITFAFSAIGSLTSVVLIAVIYGLCFGIVISILTPVTTLLADSQTELGLRLGIAYACAGAAELAGPPIMGALLSENQWWRPSVFSGSVILVSAVCFGAVSYFIRARKPRS